MEPRSRSPAMASEAICMPPKKAFISRKNGMKPSAENAVRRRELKTSARSTASGRTSIGLIPRLTSRRAATSCP